MRNPNYPWKHLYTTFCVCVIFWFEVCFVFIFIRLMKTICTFVQFICMTNKREFLVWSVCVVRCGCDECVTSRFEDSLRHSRSRINAYRALASPSLIALSSKDPILTAFELSWELRRLSFMEHEFKLEYQVCVFDKTDVSY